MTKRCRPILGSPSWTSRKKSSWLFSPKNLDTILSKLFAKVGPISRRGARTRLRELLRHLVAGVRII